MTKKEFYSKMHDLFVKHFGEDFKEHRLEIKKRLCAGEAPEINKLYQVAVYDLRLFGGNPFSSFGNQHYNIWEYERYNRVFKYL